MLSSMLRTFRPRFRDDSAESTELSQGDVAGLSEDAVKLGGEAIHWIYQSLLGRLPDEAAKANCIELIRGGASLSDIELLIRQSAEFQGRVSARSAEHPLAAIDAVWREDRISYFTHRGKYRPLALTIETVNICNNDCIICPYSMQTRKRQIMPMDTFETILAQYSEIGGGPVGLTPMVGEIFLDKKLIERLDLINRYPAISELSAISNASMVDLYDDAELSAVLGRFKRLTISVYGLDREEFKAMTRKDAYDRFIAGTVRLLRLGGPDKVLLASRQLKKRSETETRAWLDRLAQDAGLCAPLTMSGTHHFANWSVMDTRTPLPFDAEWRPPQRNVAQCALPLISAQILVDGTVSFCGCANFDGNFELNLGNVRDNSLKSLMASERVRSLWDWASAGVPEFCKTCTFHMPIDALRSTDEAFSDPLGTFGG